MRRLRSRGALRKDAQGLNWLRKQKGPLTAAINSQPPQRLAIGQGNMHSLCLEFQPRPIVENTSTDIFEFTENPSTSPENDQKYLVTKYLACLVLRTWAGARKLEPPTGTLSR